MSILSLIVALFLGASGEDAASAVSAAGDRASSAIPATLGIARLEYGGGGDWYANPSALPNLLEEVRVRTGLTVAEREVVLTPLDPALRDYPFLFMTGHGEVAFTDAERRALRDYLESGGFLLADDTYGLNESFRREMALLFPDRPLTELPADHPIFQVYYELPGGLPKVHEHDGGAPQAFGIFHEGRLVVFYSFESDLSDGWEDPEVHDNPPAVREAALRMGVNLFLYAVSRAAR